MFTIDWWIAWKWKGCLQRLTSEVSRADELWGPSRLRRYPIGFENCIFLNIWNAGLSVRGNSVVPLVTYCDFLRIRNIFSSHFCFAPPLTPDLFYLRRVDSTLPKVFPLHGSTQIVAWLEESSGKSTRFCFLSSKFYKVKFYFIKGFTIKAVKIEPIIVTRNSYRKTNTPHAKVQSANKFKFANQKQHGFASCFDK